MNTSECSFELMEARKAWFLELAGRIDIAAPLGPDEWSLSQVIDHLVIVEKGLLMALMRATEPMPSRSSEDLERLQKYAEVLRTGTKYDVPVPTVFPGESPSIEQLAIDWAKVREKMLKSITSGSLPGAELKVFDHPIGGPMNATESFQFAADHLVYHQVRVEQCLAAL